MKRPTIPSSLPPEAWEPILRMARLARRPLERFLRIEAASGVLLFIATVIAMVWANSAWAANYFDLWKTPVGFHLGSLAFERSLEWVVNDGLMVIFFFVVGLEIRREIHHGELSTLQRASLPAVAAMGGMLAPAALYLVIAHEPATQVGWGVPMATDIAFALGVLALLGKRVPPALRVLLLALAVIDDLGAIVVIALFYSSGVVWASLAVALAGLAGVLIMQRIGVRSKVLYVIPALVAWAGVYSAGIHPTIAGVIIGLMTPVRAWLGAEGFVVQVRDDLSRIAKAGSLSSHELAETLNHVNEARREAMSPAESLIEALHPWVAFGIMPIFALANAGVVISSEAVDATALSVASATAIGLLVGKPVGVLLACSIALKLRLSALPRGLTYRHLLVLAVVAGVGFTMALFVAQLAFTDILLLAAAKRGVLIASVCAAVLALILGRVLLSFSTSDAAATADEAEQSTTH